MFCKNCGNKCADTDNVCSQCGTRLKETSAAPSTADTLGFDLRPYVRYIALGFAALALIFGIMNLFGTYDVSISAFGISDSMPLSLAYEESSMLQFTNIMCGLLMIVVACVSGLYGLKELNGMPYYDQYIAKTPIGKLSIANQPLTLIGGAGAAVGLLQFIMYLFIKVEEYGIKVTFSVHWTTWILILLGAGLVAVDKFVLNKKIAE